MLQRGPLVSILSCAILATLVEPVEARHAPESFCGTTRETPAETQFLHRQIQRARAARASQLPLPSPSATRDAGNIAIIEDTGGIVDRANQFNLDNNTLTFTPTAPGASHFTYSISPQSYDAAAANATPLVALDDDDARSVNLPFAFPFFGATYSQVFVNSDGNLTFTAAEFASTARVLGRMTAGPPRIAPLFDDLDPSKTAGGVRVLSSPARVVVSWVAVPEYSDSGAGVPETFQVRLYPDGRIEFAYNGINSNLAGAVVGIAPGHLQGAASLVDFRGDPPSDYSAAVAEIFGNTLTLDTVTVAQQFYQTHEDSYDYLVIYNNMNIPALGDAVAYENTVRSTGTGYNVAPQDSGQLYGSASRLQSILNMGQLSEYPADPNAIVPARAQAGDTPLTVLTHETGHLFLAFVSAKDPNDPTASPMLGYQLAHWNFAYDSEASFLEGERIADHGGTASPRFLTTDTVQNYSPLDQYLMGFRPASAVPDTFYVVNPSINGFLFNTSQLHPASGIAFDGTRRNVTVDNIVQSAGRRTPDYTVAQRRFRFAFILVVAQGSQPSASDLSQIDTYRQQFETFYAKSTSNNAVADTSLKRSMRLSLFPAAGVVINASATATLSLATAPAADLTVQLQTPNGNAQFPASIRIPAGSATTTFSFTGIKPGVEELLAVPSDPSYETTAARVEVADASLLKLVAVSGDRQVSTTAAPLPDPIVVRLTDVNNLPYPGAHIDATPSAGGSVTPQSAVADAEGQVSFRWTPGPASANQLQLAVDRLPAVTVTITAGSAVTITTDVVNAASFQSGLAAGALQTVFGVNMTGGQTAQSTYPWPPTLAGAQLLLNGSALPLLYASDKQINFYVPQNAALGSGFLTLVTPAAARITQTVNIATLQPGIFPGAILRAGSTISAVTTPMAAGDYIEIYCTGLGPTQQSGPYQTTILTPTVFIGPDPAPLLYSGLAPGYVGLYQIDVRIPAGLIPGPQPVVIELNQQHSNTVNIMIAGN